MSDATPERAKSGSAAKVDAPRLLDLFCGAGGCSVGYHRAGFDVIGVDINPQKNYPYPFVQADARALLADLAAGRSARWPTAEMPSFPVATLNLSDFAAIHASPPCQAYSQAALGPRNAGKVYPDLLAATRDALEATGLPWVIENVPGAPMRPDFKLCGCQFQLDLRRERWFETSWRAFALTPPCHHPYPVVSVVGHGTPTWVRERLGFNPTIHHYRAAMGIDWMNRNELSQAIPPAYTEHIGGHLMAALKLTPAVEAVA